MIQFLFWLLRTYLCIHSVTKCHLHRKLGKLQMSSSTFIVVSTNWVAFHQRAAHSEPLSAADKVRPSELRTASCAQGWWEVQDHPCGISSQPIYPEGVFSVPLTKFRAIKPYSEAILWISLEAKHHLKQFDSFFSVGCWDDTTDDSELCHSDKAFNCLTRQFYKGILEGLL